MSLATTLTQDEVIQILGGLRLMMESHRTTLYDEGYSDPVGNIIHLCQELFDEYWLLLDSTSMARLTSQWYRPGTDLRVR